MKYPARLKILIFVLSRNLNETPKNHHSLTAYTKYNFITGQCALAEIMCHGFERKLLVNTGWPIYKVQSVLPKKNPERSGFF